MDEEQLKFLLGCRIKQLRDYRKLTQEQFCSQINLEQPNLSNIETGKTLPSLTTFISIINVLNVNSNNLLDFISNYSDIDLSDEYDKEIFKYIISLPETTKKVIAGLIKKQI